jgi:hypothetical protein
MRARVGHNRCGCALRRLRTPEVGPGVGALSAAHRASTMGRLITTIIIPSLLRRQKRGITPMLASQTLNLVIGNSTTVIITTRPSATRR